MIPYRTNLSIIGQMPYRLGFLFTMVFYNIQGRNFNDRCHDVVPGIINTTTLGSGTGQV